MKIKKAWIELYKGKNLPDWTTSPTVMFIKPLKREIKCAEEFNYHIYECEIKIGKQLK
jgi:hypothetical protein